MSAGATPPPMATESAPKKTFASDWNTLSDSYPKTDIAATTPVHSTGLGVVVGGVVDEVVAGVVDEEVVYTHVSVKLRQPEKLKTLDATDCHQLSAAMGSGDACKFIPKKDPVVK
mmetsp:Transcript_6653/g.13150  ORF Transcript_6653/g.13150 Transcript_6653/m.13150 type:complete len:115 (-) Transcript_6653:2325-2669(-)